MNLSDSNCPQNPLICERSVFYEWFKKKKIVRWIECVRSYQDEEGEWHEKNQGTICKHNPRDWWVIYKETEKTFPLSHRA